MKGKKIRLKKVRSASGMTHLCRKDQRPLRSVFRRRPDFSCNNGSFNHNSLVQTHLLSISAHVQKWFFDHSLTSRLHLFDSHAGSMTPYQSSSRYPSPYIPSVLFAQSWFQLQSSYVLMVSSSAAWDPCCIHQFVRCCRTGVRQSRLVQSVQGFLAGLTRPYPDGSFGTRRELWNGSFGPVSA